MSTVVEVQDLIKTFKVGREPIEVLKGLSLQVKRGDFITIMGPSGSGKSTLLNILSSIEDITDGKVIIDNMDLSTADLIQIRRYKTSIIYQDFNLLTYLTALENVMFPMMLAGAKETNAKQKALDLLEKVQLMHRKDHAPDDLSGGEKQRVAIARALANTPLVLLADEPTGNLDSKTGDSIIELFREVTKNGITVIMVTHDLQIAKQTDRILVLREGVLHSEDELVNGV